MSALDGVTIVTEPGWFVFPSSISERHVLVVNSAGSTYSLHWDPAKKSVEYSSRGGATPEAYEIASAYFKAHPFVAPEWHSAVRGEAWSVVVREGHPRVAVVSDGWFVFGASDIEDCEPTVEAISVLDDRVRSAVKLGGV